MLDPMGNTRVYVKGVLEAEGFPVADVSDHLARDDAMVWVDLCDPTKEQLAELADELGLHELAVEDALGPHQRPKLDHYASHKFLVCHAAWFDRDSSTLATTEIDAFVNERWLITVRKNEGFPIDRVKARWDRSPDLAVNGVSFLLYGLLDAVVDGYFTAVNRFDDFYDTVSEELFAEKPLQPSEQQVWFRTRQALMKFRRIVVPMREAISGLMRREQGTIDEEMYPYYQDVYDHVIRVNESADALRDLVSTLVETNLSLRDYRANQIMKLVTSWAAIIAVPTLITGWYGMNVPYPGSGETWGVWAAAGLVIALSAALYVLFRRRNWL
jgi:magnesium transporter